MCKGAMKGLSTKSPVTRGRERVQLRAISDERLQNCKSMAPGPCVDACRLSCIGVISRRRALWADFPLAQDCTLGSFQHSRWLRQKIHARSRSISGNSCRLCQRTRLPTATRLRPRLPISRILPTNQQTSLKTSTDATSIHRSIEFGHPTSSGCQARVNTKSPLAMPEDLLESTEHQKQEQTRILSHRYLKSVTAYPPQAESSRYPPRLPPTSSQFVHNRDPSDTPAERLYLLPQ